MYGFLRTETDLFRFLTSVVNTEPKLNLTEKKIDKGLEKYFFFKNNSVTTEKRKGKQTNTEVNLSFAYES